MEPMHKFDDPKLFHVMSEEELRLEYAPKEVDGVVLRPEDAATLDAVEQARRAVDVRTPEHFSAEAWHAHDEPGEVVEGVNFSVKPAAHLHAGIASGKSLQAKTCIELVPQFLASSIAEPAVDFLRR